MNAWAKNTVTYASQQEEIFYRIQPKNYLDRLCQSFTLMEPTFQAHSDAIVFPVS